MAPWETQVAAISYRVITQYPPSGCFPGSGHIGQKCFVLRVSKSRNIDVLSRNVQGYPVQGHFYHGIPSPPPTSLLHPPPPFPISSPLCVFSIPPFIANFLNYLSISFCFTVFSTPPSPPTVFSVFLISFFRLHLMSWSNQCDV
jgi:hypothetical protein